MYTAISILIIIVSILLTIVVLVQNSKGGGLAANFASGNQTFGVRQTADFLEKATWTLAICIAILSVVAAYTLPSRGEMGHDSVLMENALNDNAVNPETLPGFEAPAATEEAGN